MMVVRACMCTCEEDVFGNQIIRSAFFFVGYMRESEACVVEYIQESEEDFIVGYGGVRGDTSTC